MPLLNMAGRSWKKARMDDMGEKRMAENYEITQGICIGDREVVFGVDEKADMPYLCGFYASNGIFESYQECMAGDDYVEMAELFADRVKEQCGKVRREQERVTVPRVRITAGMCTPTFRCGDITGKVMAVRPEALRPEYRTAEHQLMYVTGGNGARDNPFGSACYCTALYSGRKERWERHDLAGEVRQECLPHWAKERADKIREQLGAGHKEREAKGAAYTGQEQKLRKDKDKER